MTKPKILTKVLFFVVILLTLANYFFIYKPYKEEKITKNIILEASKEENFLVIGEKVLSVKISKKQQSEGIINSLLFSHVLKIEGNVKVYYGYNLDNQTIEIAYNHLKQCVRINPRSKPEILTAEIVFPIEYTSKSGVIYKLLKEDKQKDLNDMLALLTQEGIKQTQDWITQQDSQTFTQQLRDFIQSKVSKFNIKICTN